MLLSKPEHNSPSAIIEAGQQLKRKAPKGFSLIELLIVVAVIGILAAIAIPNLLASRRAANEASAINSLRTIAAAEITYRATFGQGEFGDLTQLAGQNMIDGALAGATTPSTAKSGYYFAVTISSEAYLSRAAASDLRTGRRRFSSDQSGVIYGDSDDPTTLPATTTGTPIGN